jgi:hypothetical protein
MPVKMSKEALAEFGRRITHHYKRLGYKSGGDLADRLTKASGRTINRQMVHSWLNGLHYASQENREILAREFGIPVGDITIREIAGRPLNLEAPLSSERVPFRYKPDENNSALVRAEMSDILTKDQADQIMDILYHRNRKDA